MEFLLNRYRTITVLVLVLSAQLFLLAYQVKSRQDIPVARAWATGSFVPMARILESFRLSTIGTLNNLADLGRTQQENQRLKAELNALKLENQFLRAELATADRGKALALFQQRSPNRTLAARIVGTSTGAGAMVVLIDRGSNEGVRKGMAVITPEGIVGKVTSAYPAGSQVMLITDSSFAAGVISSKNRVHGTLRGQGHSKCSIEYIQNEEKLETGEWFFTSGDDRVFPKGLPVGQVVVAREGKLFFKEVFIVPAGLQKGLEEVLVILEGVHQPIPETFDPTQQLYLLPPPPAEPRTKLEADRVIRGVVSTDADLVLERYKRIGTVTGHAYGTGGTPNFNAPVDDAPVSGDPPGAGASAGAGPAAENAEAGRPPR